MGLVPDIQELISVDTIEDVKLLNQVWQHRRFKESVKEDNLQEVTQRNLNEVVQMAIDRQESTAKFVQEKSQSLGIAAGMMDLSVGTGRFPIGFSLPGIFGAALYSYGRLFSREEDARKWIIETGTFTDTTGNRWVDNWRYQWNIRFPLTKFIFKVFSSSGVYELAPRFFCMTIEYQLCAKEVGPFMDRVHEMGPKFRGETELWRLGEEMEGFPVEVPPFKHQDVCRPAEPTSPPSEDNS